MWLQKNINKRLIKRAIWSQYVYELEAEEKVDNFIKSNKLNNVTSFIKDWVNEMKKEAKKTLNK